MADESTGRRRPRLGDYFSVLGFCALAVRVWVLATSLALGVVLVVDTLLVEISIRGAVFATYAGGVLATAVVLAAYVAVLLWPDTDGVGEES